MIFIKIYLVIVILMCLNRFRKISNANFIEKKNQLLYKKNGMQYKHLCLF